MNNIQYYAFFGLIGITGVGTGVCFNEEEYWEEIKFLEQYMEQGIKENTLNSLSSPQREHEAVNRKYRAINFGDKVHQHLNQSLLFNCMEYGHRLRTKIISVASQKEELIEFIAKVRVVCQILEDTYQHEREERELNHSQPREEDYEIVDQELTELEWEKEEWQNLLVKLEEKLANLP